MKRLGSTQFCLSLSVCTGVVTSPAPQQDPGGRVTGSPPAVSAPAGTCGNARKSLADQWSRAASSSLAGEGRGGGGEAGAAGCRDALEDDAGLISRSWPG